MRFLRYAFFTLAVSSGCGRVTQTPADSAAIGDFGAGQRSGTRLKLAYYEFNGARQVIGIQDSERQESCSFFKWTDGNFYCTPSTHTVIGFSEDKCTNKVGVGSIDPCDTTKYFAEKTVPCSGLPTYSHVYPAGAQVSGDQYYSNETGECEPQPTYGRPLYELGPEIDVTELVRGTIGPPEGSGRVKVRFATSADGLRRAMTPAFDSQLGVDCSLTTDGQCLPSATGATVYYKDAACTTSAALIENGCPAKLVADEDTCAFRSLGAQIPSAISYSISISGCVMTPLPPNHSLFDIGTPVTLPALVRGPVEIGGRIQRIRFAELDIGEDIRMYDTETQAECFPATAPDGVVTCLPTGASVHTDYYTDKSCTAPIDIVAVAASPRRCESRSVPKFAIESTRDEGSCSTMSESRPVGPEYRAQLYYKTNGGCAPSSPLNKYYEVGPAIPQSELATGAFVIDQ